MVKWIGTCRSGQGTWVGSLVWENSTCSRAVKAHAAQLLSHISRV